MQCFHCQSPKVIKNGKYRLQDGSAIQHYLCQVCNKRFSDKTGTPMACLRTPTRDRIVRPENASGGHGRESK